jgi:hypothetical protein
MTIERGGSGGAQRWSSFMFAANSISRLIASARDVRSTWERRTGATICKNCSETRI